ncbi:MAG TPA: HAMP domain-containing sensor histidine kinase [Chloroflexota bacterium]
MTARRIAVADGRSRTAERTGRGAPWSPRDAVLWLRGFLGRHISVRWKLTIWYGVMCLLILGIVGFGMRQALHQQVSSSVDSALRDTANKMTTSLSRSVVAPGSVAPVPSGCASFAPVVQQYCGQMQRALNVYSQELAAPGQVQQIDLLVAPPFVPGGPPPVAGAPQLVPYGHALAPFPGGQDWRIYAVGQTGRPQFTTVSAGGKDLRVYLVAIQPPANIKHQGVAAVLQVFQNKQTYDAIERTFDIILLLGIPLGLLVALVAGWWIARAALRPIVRISNTVRTIGESRDLSRRLRFVGPSDEVGKLAVTFDGMMERLERAFETQKRFVADASHELRTPLTAIRGNADLMMIAPPEDREACLSAIRRESERMSRLVSDLLLLAEADVETQPLHLRLVDLDELLLDVHHSATVLADGKVEVVLEKADAVRIEVDPDRIQQLLLNLIDNAVKFTPAGGSVTLSLRAEGDGASIEVADSGVGIPPEAQRSIFERFYRVEEARSTRGSGLGLAICAWIVSAHRGTISVRSQPGKGSTFSVMLPGPPTERAVTSSTRGRQTDSSRLLN